MRIALPIRQSSRVDRLFMLLSVFALLCPVGIGALQNNGSSEIAKHFQLARDAVKNGNPDVADREFRAILTLDPRNAEAYANIGFVAFERKRFEDAAESFQKALQLKPALWSAKAFLGMARMQLGATSSAVPLLEQSFPHLQDSNLQVQAGMSLVRFYQDANSFERAADILRVLRKQHPDDPMILYATYRTYSDLAAHAVADLLKSAPDSSAIHLVKAQAYLTDNDFAGAVAEDSRALEIDPNLPGIHFEIGRALMASSQEQAVQERAEGEFELELKLNPGDAYSHYELGEIAWSRAEYQSAIERFSQACKLRPDFIDAQIGLGKALTASGKANEALVPLQKAARLDSENEVVHYRLAQAYRKVGEIERSAAELNEFKILREVHKARSLDHQEQRIDAPSLQTVDSVQ